MNQYLQNILNLIEQDENVTAGQKEAIAKSLKAADKELEITTFKLDRTEKVKKTTAILLEETIEELEQKRKVIEESHTALQQSLEELKAAQQQLIQAEKMASLGELTAGIAHEIQNPLNFVNNFSEVSSELIDELQDERQKPEGERDKSLEDEILNDIKKNLEKINHHGKRADGIVKGMLQHSRSSSGQKEPTDINALCDEYLRLAYHGLRAKDKAFNAKFETDFDDSVGKVDIIPQDIGRVVMNLLTNAFYAVNEKKKQQPEGYEPTVSVSTKREKDNVEVKVKDSGNGIPEKILDKIFQPFFTTKPTGQGTGLGLSLSYDIIKAHGGELKVETKEGEGTTFIISIPTNSFSIFGTANGEVFYGKENAMDFYTATVDQLAGKVRLRNRDISLQELDTDTVLVREQADVYALIQDEWTFYGHARISCILKHTGEGWKGVHQHASFPDHRTEEGQQIAAEKIAKENLELREAVKRRTVELEHKNRELEIEAAVEKVRAQSMAMQQTSDIAKVNEELYTQIAKLNIDGFTGVAFYFVGDDGMVTVWDLSSPGSMGDAVGYAFKYDSKKCPVLGEFIPIWRAAKQEYFILDFPKEKLLLAVEEMEPFYPAMAENFRSAVNSGALQHQWSTAGRLNNGILSLDLMTPPTEEVKPITLKMAGAFNLAYQRFLDLQKAEAQAREAKIEAGLERVRSKSLAMHHTSELQEVIYTVHKELLNLDIAIDGGSFIAINSDIDTQLRCWGSGGTADTSEEVILPLYEKPFCAHLIAGIKKGPGFFTEEFTQKEKEEFFTFLLKHEPWSKLDAKQKKETLSAPGGYTRSCCVSLHTSIFIINHLGKKFSAADNDILKRFGKVFEQAYTRFLDLQKAEAQAREAQVEAALEKVRSRSLAMHKSDEIGEVIWIIIEKMKELNIEAQGISVATFIPGSKDLWHWHANAEMPGEASTMLMPYFDNLIINDCLHARDTGIELFAKLYSNEEKNNYINAAIEHTDFKYFPEELIQWIREQPYLGFSFAIQKHSGIFLEDYTGKLFSKEDNDILIRFSKVFEQAYTRFLDLQKAEAQAREAQIQLALERVRAGTMAMQKSEELLDVITIFSDQLMKLNISFDNVCFGVNEQGDDFKFWFATAGGSHPVLLHIPYINHPLQIRAIEAQKNGLDFFADTLTRDENKQWIQHIFDHSEFGSLPDKIKNYLLSSEGYARSSFILKNINLYIGNYKNIPYTEEENSIFKKFAQTFEQSYTRFLDLQKAEAQAREARIELSLERIRARVTAMKVSSDLLDIVVTMRTEFVALGHEAHYFWHMKWQPDIYEKAMTSGDGTRIGNVMTLPRHIHGNIPLIANWEKSDEPTVVYAMDAEEAVDYVEKMITLGNFEQVDHNAPTLDDIRHIGGLTFIMARTTHGEIGFSLPGVVPSPPAEGVATLVRFAAVFDLAYRRFEDLKSSEKQIREAQIELALERVRARTMAMQHSDELADASFVLDSQVRALGIKTWGCAFNIYGDNESTEWFSSEAGMLPPYKTPREDFFLRAYEAGQGGRPLYIEEFAGEDCKAHYEYLCTIPIMGDAVRSMIENGGSFPERQVDHATFFKYGYLLFISMEPVPEAHDIFIRFANVFEQTYTRFLDLQKAEAQAREAQVEAALEKVRSRTLAMQHSDEMPETAAVLFQQLIALGIEPNRLYISIVKGEAGDSEFWITDEDGTKVSTAFSANLNNNATLIKMFEGWKQQQKSLVITMEGEELDAYIRYLSGLGVPFEGGPEQKRRVQEMAYFSKGFIGMASPDKQPPETLQLLERFAAVFNLTFTRFNDLKVAEAHAVQAAQDLIEIKAARKKAEDTLAELQVTQKQLIQSEKMASLGELTAGIAHEIQNPLNFVNNFSEVSKELIDELQGEKQKPEGERDESLEDEILNDIKQNLEKINHHGKRADGIVKGMLQHSRNSAGQKELTDINVLCDEYLRLAYHGLRAKDKSFNAKFETDFDASIPKLNVVPQDIGRVILNLITNAFYVVDEKKKSGVDGYEPTIKVITRKVGNKVEVSVKDNGNGIPQKVLDKIFQPFFTTKPTGQGTGLGLSLSYDIVKAHGGELKVETKEGEGTAFIITLPAQPI